MTTLDTIDMATERGSWTFVRRTDLDAPAQDVFDWHTRPGALERLMPPFEQAFVEDRQGGVLDGGIVTLRVPMGPLRLRWVAEHGEVEPGRSFRDVQTSGPFRRWEHTHLVEPVSDTTSQLEDRIRLQLPGPSWTSKLGRRFVEAKLERLFRFRHRQTARDLARHRAVDLAPQRILITGATGLVGTALGAFLSTGGHDVVRLVRREARGPDELSWDGGTGLPDPEQLTGFDTVIHLAGENIAARRWNDAHKRAVRDSRLVGTRALAELLARVEDGPRTFLCASAVGFYGDRPGETLDESSAPGEGFLPDVCRAWEAATEPASRAGLRVVNARIGVVLSPLGGALASMLTPFRLGVAGRIGKGTQAMSWISLDDVVGALHHIVADERLSGPVNLVAPRPVTNAEFTKTLARVLRRPALLPMPATAARLAFGELADALLLSSQDVRPRALLDAGFTFQDVDLEGALRMQLGRDG